MRVLSPTVVLVILLCGCSTTTEKLTYSWDVSIIPEGASEYQFTAKLTETKRCERQTITGGQEAVHHTTWSAPTFTVKPNEPAEISLGTKGEPGAWKVRVLVEDKGDKVITTYSVHYGDGGLAHEMQGRVEIRR